MVEEDSATLDDYRNDRGPNKNRNETRHISMNNGIDGHTTRSKLTIYSDI